MGSIISGGEWRRARVVGTREQRRGRLNDQGRAGALATLFLAALTLRPQIIGIGPLLSSIQSDLHVSHAVVGLIGTIPILCMGFSRASVAPRGTVRHTGGDERFDRGRKSELDFKPFRHTETVRNEQSSRRAISFVVPSAESSTIFARNTSACGVE